MFSRVIFTFVLLLSIKMSCASDCAISDLVLPCGHVSYLNATLSNGAVFDTLMTRSRLECAQLCAKEGSCIGFNACQNDNKNFSCEHLEKITVILSCDIIIARANCSFHKKSSYNPAAYQVKAEQSLTAAGCPSDAFMLGEYHTCYWAVQNSHTYVNLTACEDTGGYLAVLPSGAVMTKLQKLIEDTSSINMYKYYWIDVNDLDEEGTYINRFGPVTWTAWDSGQPNDYSETEDQDCTIMSPKYYYDWHDRYCLNEAGYYALCFYYLKGDGYRKRYVVHKDATNTTYGNLTELIADIDRGVAVRILIQDVPGIFDDLLVQTDAIFTYHDDTERRCAQSVHNMALQGLSVLRLVLFVCTTGLLRLEVWANGAKTENTYGVLMTWFTSDRPTMNVLQTSGALDPSFNLTEAIFEGKELMIQVGIARYPLHDLYYGQNLTGQFSWVASNGNWTGVMLDNEGYIHSVDWWDSSSHTFNKESASYALLITDSWKFVYSNAGVGLAENGTIALLAEHIYSGHDVKIDIGGRVSKVDMIFIKSDEIYALLSSELVSDDMQNNLNRTVTLASTTGKIVTYVFGFEQNTNIIERSYEAVVRWFVDTSVWTEVFHAEISGSDKDGVFTLRDAMYAGQQIRLKVGTNADYDILFTADFVAYYTSTTEYIARFSRGFAFRFLSDGGITMDAPVHNLLIEVKNRNVYRITYTPNGISAVNTTTAVSATVSWYSNPYIF